METMEVKVVNRDRFHPKLWPSCQTICGKASRFSPALNEGPVEHAEDGDADVVGVEAAVDMTITDAAR
jgi:hypothetical protein